jgi:hypothetical protein
VCSPVNVKGSVFVSQEEVAANDRAGMRPGEVRRIDMEE